MATLIGRGRLGNRSPHTADATRSDGSSAARQDRKLDAFLAFNEYEVLTNAGRVSAAVARRLAEEEYAKYRVRQGRELESDFERELKRLEGEDE